MAGALYDQVMATGLGERLAALTGDRSHARAETTTRTIVALAGGAVAAAVAYGVSRDGQMAFLAGAVVAGAGWTWAQAPVTKITGDIKIKVNDTIAAALGATYQAAGGPSEDLRRLQRFGLIFASPDVETHTDGWFGDFGGADIRLHESHLQEWRQSGRTRRLETVFRGVVMSYRFARDFSGVTLVRRDAGLFNVFQAGGGEADGRRLQRVRLVDPALEKAFEVHGTDQVEARYLMHPAFCERLLEVERAFQGKNLRLVFADGRVTLALDAGDQFESGGIDPAGDAARIAATIDQIEALIALARTLNERPRG